MRPGCEFIGAVLSCVTLVSLFFFFYGSVTHTTGRLAHIVVQGSLLFKVTGKEVSHVTARTIRLTRSSAARFFLR